MSELAFVGLGMAVVAGGYLLVLHTFDTVVVMWPGRTKTREEDPDGCESNVFRWSAVGIVGLALFLAGLVVGF